MKWLEETHGIRFELVRHFLARMFDSEMFSTRGQWWTVAASALGLALPAGMLLMDPPYYHKLVVQTPENLRAVAIADQLAMLTFVLAVTGVLALLAWESLFPSRRDYLALAGLPVRSRQIFMARFISVLMLAAAITAAMSVLPTVLAPHQFTAARDLSPVARAIARAAAASLGCVFVFFSVVAIQGLLINTLPARWFGRLSTYAQGGLVAVFFLSGLYSWFIVDWGQETIAALPAFGGWAPPVWFVGLHQAILGDRDPFFAAMARRGLTAAAGSVALAGLMYVLAYSRYRKLLLESPDGAAQRGEWKWSASRLLARDPRQRAVMQFMVKALSRSRVHRLTLMAYAGAAIAIMINSLLLAGAARRWTGWRQMAQFAVLYWPIGVSFITLAGVRHAFLMPVDRQASWLFRITEHQGRREWMSAVERFVMGYVIAPIHLLTLPLAAALLGWPVAMRMTALQALVSLSAFEFLFYSWQQLPFTCSYSPGKRPLTAQFGSWIAVLALLVPLLSRIIAGLSQLLGVFLFFAGVFAVAWLWARRQRREGWGESKLLWEDRDGAVADLGIKDMTYRGAAALTDAFPDEFKNAYGEEMLQVTEEAIEPVWRRHGALGLFRLLADIAVRVAAEHAAELRQDIRYGLRMLIASPGFTAVAVISLGLGIGIGTSGYSVVHTTIMRRVPGIQKPEELTTLRGRTSYPNYQRYSERTDLFASTLAYAPAAFGVAIDGSTERTWGHLVTASYFSTLGVQPAMGRTFEEGERAPSVVISERFWRERLGSDPSILGKTLRINGQACTVVGVGPKEFLGPAPLLAMADLWMPLSVDARVAPELGNNALERRDVAMLQMIGRLKPGVSIARAEAELDTVARRLEQAYGDADRERPGKRVTLVTGGRMVPIRPENLPMLLSVPIVMTGLMLLIACTNVANMMLARAAARRKEIAVRLALGASRGRLIRQLLTESMLVACGAGALGFCFTAWLMRLYSQSDALRISIGTPYPMPMSGSMAPDGQVLMFSIGLAVFTGLAFGLAPAFRATRTDLTPALKEGGSIELHRYGRLSLRNLLMLSQVAGSVTLLLLTVALTVSYSKALGLDVGFDPNNLYLLSLDPVRDGYSGPRAEALFTKLLERVKTLPSVTAASLTDTTPMWAPPMSVTFSSDNAVGGAEKFVVGKDYFDTLGVPILMGRGFRTDDEAVVSERLVREFWKGANPLGRRIEIGREVFQVVGVARKTRVSFTIGEARSAIYLPLRAENYARPSFTGITLMVRTAPGVDALSAVRREIAAVDSNLTPFNGFRMPEQIDRLMFVSRIGVYMYGSMGMFGLVLASIGLAGMTAYSVAQRGREIGIRMALGASSGDVLGLVMKEGAALVVVGTVVGLAGAWAGTRVLSFLVQMTSVSTGLDLTLLVGAPMVLAGLALLACYVPARRSLRIDPVVALRQE